MIWQHIYIPVLPPHLMDYLLAPMPYLAGVPTTTWEVKQQQPCKRNAFAFINHVYYHFKMQRVRKSELGEMVVLDVDSNRVETPFNDLECLPPDIVSIGMAEAFL